MYLHLFILVLVFIYLVSARYEKLNLAALVIASGSSTQQHHLMLNHLYSFAWHHLFSAIGTAFMRMAPLWQPLVFRIKCVKATEVFNWRKHHQIVMTLNTISRLNPIKSLSHAFFNAHLLKEVRKCALEEWQRITCRRHPIVMPWHLDKNSELSKQFYLLKSRTSHHVERTVIPLCALKYSKPKSVAVTHALNSHRFFTLQTLLKENIQMHKPLAAIWPRHPDHANASDTSLHK